MLASVTDTQDARNAVWVQPHFAAIGFRFSNPWMQQGHNRRLDKNAPLS